MAKDLAIILNNGSINSAVTTALAAQKYRVVLLYAEVGRQSWPPSADGIRSTGGSLQAVSRAHAADAVSGSD